ncbi:MAG: hypothetical protein ACKV19_00640 [Verrucomicrobiales bacterium]
MKNPIQLPAADPSAHFTPDDAIGQWTPQQAQPHSGFPQEVPRHPPEKNPDWGPGNAQEAPVHEPAPIPDWSPSSSAGSPIVRHQQGTTKHDSPPLPEGKHDQGDAPDERGDPIVVEDPRPEDHPVDEGGDVEEPESEKRAVLVAGSGAAPIRVTPSGRLMRFTSDEVYY